MASTDDMRKKIKPGRGRKPNAPNVGNVMKTNVRLDPDMKAKMREAMKDEGDESESVFLRKVLRRFLRDWEKKKDS